jgi:carboxypeptidase PM20D1
MLRRLLALAAVLLTALVVVLVVNAVRAGAGPAEVSSVAPVAVAVDSAGAIERFARAVRVPTISYDEASRTDTAAFRAFHESLRTSFPRVHATLSRELVAGLSLIYTWRGADATLPPVVLMGHQDVVPVIPGTEASWTQPPFGGVIADGFLWGRGTLDDKVSVLAILEAVEGALAEGVVPPRTIYLAFGHDEESGGAGARAIRDTLVARGIGKPAFVLDEGGALMDGARVGLSGPVAMVAVAEKGFLTLELSVKEPGGHSSTPPKQTAIGRLSAAILKLEQNPMPASLDGPTRTMFEAITPGLPFGQRIVMANQWLFEPLVVRMLVADPQTAAMLRTTTAPTIIHAGVKSNVLPIDAKASVNFRLRPGDTQAIVIERVRGIIADTGVTVTVSGFSVEPSPVSDHTGPGFALIERSLREVYTEPGLTMVPFLVMGGTDARYWAPVTDQTFRFIAAPTEADALTRVHGTNERVALGAYITAVRFFRRVIGNLGTL